ncbi:Cna B-type domain-containing protein, partial [Enterococcus casseliflavus]|nr:Cna B-type domain-containing protein [Enterococcus casseliflavus]
MKLRRTINIFAVVLIFVSNLAGSLPVLALTNEGESIEETSDIYFEKGGNKTSELSLDVNDTEEITLVDNNPEDTVVVVPLPDSVSLDLEATKDNLSNSEEVIYDSSSNTITINYSKNQESSNQRTKLILQAKSATANQTQSFFTKVTRADGKTYRSDFVQVTVTDARDEATSVSTVTNEEDGDNGDSDADSEHSSSQNKATDATTDNSNSEKTSVSTEQAKIPSFSRVSIQPRDILSENSVTPANFLDYFTLGGDATYDPTSGVVTLTPDERAKVGNFTLNDRLSMDDSFELVGQVFLGTKLDSQKGADGIGFAFHEDEVGSVGYDGANMGIGGLKNAVGFKLDSYFNKYQASNPNDPSSNAQLGWDEDPTTNTGSSKGQAETPFGAFVTTNDTNGYATTDSESVQYLNKDNVLNADADFIPISFSYDGTTHLLTIIFDGMTWTKEVNSEASLAMAISASTGTNYNLQQFKFESFQYTSAVRKSVQKIWKDYDNAFNTRPESITVNLLKNGNLESTQELSDDNDWSYTFDNLSKYDAGGKEYEYTIEEEAVAGYTSSSIVDGDTTTLTNTQLVEPAKLESEKHVYDLDGNLLDEQEVKVGDAIEYVIKTEVDGEQYSFVNNIVITDNLPVGLDYVADSAYLTIDGEVVEDATINFADNTLTANVGTLKGGQTAELHFQATVNKEAKEGITNVATVDYTVPTTPGEPDEPGEPQEPSVPVETPADISLEKTVDKASAQVGDTLTYT